VFANFSLPDLATVSRRTVLGALVIGVMGLVGSLLLSDPLIGLGLCIGLGIGILNFRLIQRSVVKVGERQDENKRRPLALNTLGRLAVISVVALALLFVSFDLGLGVMVGLAAFQGLLLLNVTRSMFKMGHLAAGGAVGAIDVEATDGATAGSSPAPAELRDEQRGRA
jgi:O-antigen/teichoic acid export membrane protein